MPLFATSPTGVKWTIYERDGSRFLMRSDPHGKPPVTTIQLGEAADIAALLRFLQRWTEEAAWSSGCSGQPEGEHK